MGFFLHVVFIISNWFPSVLGYNLIFGKGKILHFGPVGTVLVCGYAFVITLQATGSHFWGFVVCLIASQIISVFFAWLSLRLEPDGLGIMSIAVHLALLAVVLNWNSVTRGALGIPGIQRMPIFQSQASIAIAMVIVAILWMIFMIFVDKSSLGRQLTALSENEWHAKSLGINRAYVQTVAFMIAGVGTSIVIFFWMQYIGLLHPNDSMFPVLIMYVMITVAGKPGSVLGVSLAIVLLVFLKEGLRLVPLPPDILGPMRLVLFGLILFIAVWIRRDTLFPHERKV